MSDELIAFVRPTSYIHAFVVAYTNMYQFETDLLLSCGLPLFVIRSNLNVSILHFLCVLLMRSLLISGSETGLSM